MSTESPKGSAKAVEAEERKAVEIETESEEVIDFVVG